MTIEFKAEILSRIISQIRQVRERYAFEPVDQVSIARIEDEITAVLTKHLDNQSPTVKAKQISTNEIEIQYLDKDGVSWHLYPLLKVILKL